VNQPRPPLRDSYEGLFGQAQMAHRAGGTDAAISLYRRLVSRLARLNEKILVRRPDLGEMHLRAGLELTELLRSEGRYAEAYETKSLLAASHPHMAEEWRRDLAVMRVAKGDVEPGLDELRALAEENAGDPEGWITLGTEARIEGRLTESQAALDRALETSSRDDPGELAAVHFQHFLLYKEMGSLDDAVAAWEEAVNLDPEKRSTIRELYTMLTDAGRYTEAKQYIAQDENPLQSGFQRGLVAQLTGNSRKARDEWQIVADLDPISFESGYDCWVEAVLRLGDPEPALQKLQDLLAKLPTPRLLTLAGIAWAMRGDTELATALFQQATNQLRRHRPPKQKLDSADWRLLNSLITDDKMKSALRPHFAVIETVWG